MVEQPTPLRDVNTDTSEALNRLKMSVDELMDSLDLRQAVQRVQDFGREKPIVLMFAAFTVGLAAGMLARRNVQVK